LFTTGILDLIPVWLFFFLLVLAALIPMELGQRFGMQRRRSGEHGGEAAIGNVVGAMLALLGFIVALTLGAAAVRFDARKDALINSINVLETAYRNAALVPEPHKSESRKLLREMVEIRLNIHELYSEHEELGKLDANVELIKAALWSQAEALAQQDRSSEVYALFTSSVNDVFEGHNKRVILGGVHRIPAGVWIVLVLVTLITTFGVGFQFGLLGSRSITASLCLTLTFALVMTIIFDIDQPGKGWIGVDQKPMYYLYEKMKANE
jgi:hypothetical protein